LLSRCRGRHGSVAGQIAKARGAKKVIGIAGGPEKCAEVVEKYGFDECLDYRQVHLARALHEACPKGIDVYFDNVGGEILDAVLSNIAVHGRIILCGAISQYISMQKPKGLANTSMLIVRRARMEGFIVFRTSARGSPRPSSNWRRWSRRAPWYTRSTSCTDSNTRQTR